MAIAGGDWWCPEHPDAKAPTEDQRQVIFKLRARNVAGVTGPIGPFLDNCAEHAAEVIDRLGHLVS